FSPDHSKLAITSTNTLWILNMETYELMQYQLSDVNSGTKVSKPLFSDNAQKVVVNLESMSDRSLSVYDLESLTLKQLSAAEGVVGWDGNNHLITVANKDTISEFSRYNIDTDE